MTDEEFAAYCAIEVADVGKISAEKRAAIERMHEVEGEIALWQAGLGPKPTGVIMCFDHDHKVKP